MNVQTTELVFILDKSGSMSGLESDTIGGFNSVIEKQKNMEGKAFVTTVLFNQDFEVIHHRDEIEKIVPMTKKEYFVGGSTALLDALGITIKNVKAQYINQTVENRPNKVMFIITTDGLENASREFSYSEIKAMIEYQKTMYDWEFLFLGANMDAENEAKKFGIEKERTVNYHHDSAGTKAQYNSMNRAVTEMRKTGSISNEWKEEVDNDFTRRKQTK